MMNFTMNPPKPFLWQAPASAQKTKQGKTDRQLKPRGSGLGAADLELPLASREGEVPGGEMHRGRQSNGGLPPLLPVSGVGGAFPRKRQPAAGHLRWDVTSGGFSCRSVEIQAGHSSERAGGNARNSPQRTSLQLRVSRRCARHRARWLIC